MAKAGAGTRLENLWDEARAAGMTEPEKLLYRSNLLGSDKRITNYGGGNTTAKVMERDPLTGETVEVLWVKGSGGDVGSIKMDGFATLYMDKLRALKGIYRGVAFEDEMVGCLPHCTFNLNPRAASIDTPLHAYVPQDPCRSHAPRRDHRHRRLGQFARVDAAHLRRRDRLAALEAAGLRAGPVAGEVSAWNIPTPRAWCWKATACSPGMTTRRSCYETTLRDHQPRDGLVRRRDGGQACLRRRARRSRWQPEARRGGGGAADAGDPGHDLERSPHGRAFRRQPGGAGVRELRRGLEPLAALGTSCPDHFLRTKIRPLVVEFDPAKPDIEATLAALAGAGGGLSRRLRRLLRRAASTLTARPCATRMRWSTWCPGVGMLTFAKDKATARISGEFYVNAINVMRGASTVSELSRPARAGGLRHRILAAGRGQAAADAEAQEPCGPGGLRHRRRGRHRVGHGGALPAGRRLRDAGRYRRGSAGSGRRRIWHSAMGATWCARCRWT